MTRATALIAIVFVLGLGNPASAQQLLDSAARPAPARQPEVIPDQYIVELHRGASVDAVARAHGVTPLRRYTIINGFVAHMPRALASRLAGDPDVRLVSPDVVVRAFGKPAGSPGKGKGGGGGGGGGTTCPSDSPDALVPQDIPTGVARIGAPAAWNALPVPRTGSDVKVVVIDTGIDYCHPDLRDNYKGGINLLDSTQSPRDDNGHGTHVSGIIAARQNDIGVVGVAPDASLYAVKMLDASGSGALSGIVDGLDWAVKNGMRVANLSLGAADFWCLLGLCGIGSECTAIGNAVKAGVVVVVAAGNSADEALGYTPANCQDSLTVSAFADSNGASGGGGPTMRGGAEEDDTFARSFSNYSDYVWDQNGDGVFSLVDHPVVDIMGPGVEIRSTLPTYSVTLTTSYGLPLNYGVLSGTSMATPHVAGAAALYIGAHSGASADDVRKALVTDGECPAGGTTGGGPICSSAWKYDPDTVWEPLVRAGGL